MTQYSMSYLILLSFSALFNYCTVYIAIFCYYICSDLLSFVYTFCLQKFIKQKMESNNSQMLNQAKETASICSQLNLDINRLENSTLMDNPIYTRLYNIVKNDMSRKDMAFRKNLIKQIYFLLQVTPVIRSQLQELFLEQVQKVYNLHDHKKIDLASNKLNNLLSIVHSKKESTYSNFERPKSGVTWNKNVPSFLRPYTASRKTPKNNTSRPDSSKFNQSTKVSWEDVEIRQFTTNIEEQLEISKDFMERHRTLHPEYEPVYEQLYNILKTIEPKRVEEPSLSITAHKSIKYPRSAVTRTKEQSWVYPEQNRQSEHLNTSEAQEEQIYNSNQVQQQKDGEQSSEEEEYIYQNQKKKPFKPYSQQFKPEVVTKQTKDRENCMKKYSHIVNTKLVQAAREDQQMAEKYVHYARVKSALRRQMNRRNQSKRLMSAKPFSQSTLKYTQLVQTSNKQNEEKDSHTIDLTKDPLALPSERINAHPTYNRRQFLKNKYEYPLNQFKKTNNISYVHSSQAKIQNAKRPMTAYTRFHSPQKFDPLNPDNVKQYNNDVLQELQKIKSKLGGKCYASTESLMKALAVPEPHLPDDLTWESKNPFYNMVSMGRKKLKKKSRKGVKLQKKGLSVRR